MDGLLPPSTVARLPRYLRFLESAGATTVSSDDIARGSGVSAAQVRKDLSFLGSLGTRGLGYHAQGLATLLRRALGLGDELAVAIAGAGNLGSALSNYRGFDARGFRVVAVYDASPKRIGTTLGSVVVGDITELDTDVERLGIAILAIATPPEAAQDVADRAVAAGVRALLNFAPVVITVPPTTTVRQVDLATELQILGYHLSRH